MRKNLRERLRLQKEEGEQKEKKGAFNHYEIQKIVKSIKSQHYHQRIQQINQVPDIIQRFHKLQTDSHKLYSKIDKSNKEGYPSDRSHLNKQSNPMTPKRNESKRKEGQSLCDIQSNTTMTTNLQHLQSKDLPQQSTDEPNQMVTLNLNLIQNLKKKQPVNQNDFLESFCNQGFHRNKEDPVQAHNSYIQEVDNCQTARLMSQQWISRINTYKFQLEGIRRTIKARQETIARQEKQQYKDNQNQDALLAGLHRDEQAFKQTNAALQQSQYMMDNELHQQLKLLYMIQQQKHDSQVYYDLKEHLERKVLLENQAIYLGNDRIIKQFTLLETNNQALNNYFRQRNIRNKIIQARKKDFQDKDKHENACQRFLEFELQQNLDYENQVIQDYYDEKNSKIIQKIQIQENDKIELQNQKQLYFQWKMKIGKVKQVLTNSKIQMNSTEFEQLILEKKTIVKNMWDKKEMLEKLIEKRNEEISQLGQLQAETIYQQKLKKQQQHEEYNQKLKHKHNQEFFNIDEQLKVEDEKINSLILNKSFIEEFHLKILLQCQIIRDIFIFRKQRYQQIKQKSTLSQNFMEHSNLINETQIDKRIKNLNNLNNILKICKQTKIIGKLMREADKSGSNQENSYNKIINEVI